MLTAIQHQMPLDNASALGTSQTSDPIVPFGLGYAVPPRDVVDSDSQRSRTTPLGRSR